MFLNLGVITTLIRKDNFIDGISYGCRKTIDLLSHIFEEVPCENINYIIKITDIEATINTLHYFVKDIPDDNEADSLHIALSNLNNIINELTEILNAIKKKTEDHRMKYFASYRSVSYLEEIDKLKTNIAILHIRFDLLIKILKKN